MWNCNCGLSCRQSYYHYVRYPESYPAYPACYYVPIQPSPPVVRWVPVGPPFPLYFLGPVHPDAFSYGNTAFHHALGKQVPVSKQLEPSVSSRGPRAPMVNTISQVPDISQGTVAPSASRTLKITKASEERHEGSSSATQGIQRSGEPEKSKEQTTGDIQNSKEATERDLESKIKDEEIRLLREQLEGTSKMYEAREGYYRRQVARARHHHHHYKSEHFPLNPARTELKKRPRKPTSLSASSTSSSRRHSKQDEPKAHWTPQELQRQRVLGFQVSETQVPSQEVESTPLIGFSKKQQEGTIKEQKTGAQPVEAARQPVASKSKQLAEGPKPVTRLDTALRSSNSPSEGLCLGESSWGQRKQEGGSEEKVEESKGNCDISTGPSPEQCVQHTDKAISKKDCGDRLPIPNPSAPKTIPKPQREPEVLQPKKSSGGCPSSLHTSSSNSNWKSRKSTGSIKVESVSGGDNRGIRTGGKGTERPRTDSTELYYSHHVPISYHPVLDPNFPKVDRCYLFSQSHIYSYLSHTQELPETDDSQRIQEIETDSEEAITTKPAKITHKVQQEAVTIEKKPVKEVGESTTELTIATSKSAPTRSVLVTPIVSISSSLSSLVISTINQEAEESNIKISRPGNQGPDTNSFLAPPSEISIRTFSSRGLESNSHSQPRARSLPSPKRDPKGWDSQSDSSSAYSGRNSEAGGVYIVHSRSDSQGSLCEDTINRDNPRSVDSQVRFNLYPDQESQLKLSWCAEDEGSDSEFESECKYCQKRNISNREGYESDSDSMEETIYYEKEAVSEPIIVAFNSGSARKDKEEPRQYICVCCEARREKRRKRRAKKNDGETKKGERRKTKKKKHMEGTHHRRRHSQPKPPRTPSIERATTPEHNAEAKEKSPSLRYDSSQYVSASEMKCRPSSGENLLSRIQKRIQTVQNLQEKTKARSEQENFEPRSIFEESRHDMETHRHNRNKSKHHIPPHEHHRRSSPNQSGHHHHHRRCSHARSAENDTLLPTLNPLQNSTSAQEILEHVAYKAGKALGQIVHRSTARSNTTHSGPGHSDKRVLEHVAYEAGRAIGKLAHGEGDEIPSKSNSSSKNEERGGALEYIAYKARRAIGQLVHPHESNEETGPRGSKSKSKTRTKTKTRSLYYHHSCSSCSEILQETFSPSSSTVRSSRIKNPASYPTNHYKTRIPQSPSPSPSLPLIYFSSSSSSTATTRFSSSTREKIKRRRRSREGYYVIGESDGGVPLLVPSANPHGVKELGGEGKKSGGHCERQGAWKEWRATVEGGSSNGRGGTMGVVDPPLRMKI